MSTEVVRQVPRTVDVRLVVDVKPAARAAFTVSAGPVLVLVAAIGVLVLWAHPIDLLSLSLDAVHITAVIMLWVPILIAAAASGPSQARRRRSTFAARMKARRLGPYRPYSR